MAKKIYTTPYDAFILESFQMGKNPNEVYNKINYQELLKEQKPVLSRTAIYDRYKRWNDAGRYGEMEQVEVKRDDGEVIVIWRDIKRNTDS